MLGPIAMYGNEWIWVAVVVVLLFGASNIPKLAKNVGEGIREFKKSLSDEENNKPTPATPATTEEK